MSGHTPGPWKPSGEGVPEVGVYGCGYRLVIMTGGELNRNRANARLMAAAPELLEALQEAHAQMAMAAECIEAKRYSEALVHVDTMSIRRQSIIAKANGESA